MVRLEILKYSKTVELSLHFGRTLKYAIVFTQTILLKHPKAVLPKQKMARRRLEQQKERINSDVVHDQGIQRKDHRNR